MLYTSAGFGAVGAKLTSTVVSTTVAYLGHRYWSFSHRARTGLRREYLLFAVVNGLTLALGLVMVAFARYGLGQESPWVLQAVNVVSIGLARSSGTSATASGCFPPTTPGMPRPSQALERYAASPSDRRVRAHAPVTARWTPRRPTRPAPAPPGQWPWRVR